MVAGKTRFWLFVVAVPLCLASALAGGSETTVEKKSASPAAPLADAGAGVGWEVQCAQGAAVPVCKASQTIVVAETRQLLLAVSINKASADKNSPMLVHLPHGLFLPAGITVGVDGGAADKLDVQTCDAQGCYAGAGLAPDKIAAMSKGTQLKVTFEDLQKQKIVVAVPLKGFDAAYKKL